MEGVVGQAHRGEQLVPRQEVGAEGHCQSVGAAGDLGADQGRLGVEYIGVDPLQAVPAVVVIAVAGGSGEVVGPHPVFLHRQQDLGLVGLRRPVNGIKAVPQGFQHGLAPPADLPTEAHLFVCGQ